MTPENEFQSALAGGNRRIGALVYWRGLNGVQIERGEFRRLFEDAGVGEAVPKDPKAEKCLNIAASVASREQKRGEPVARVELKAKHTNAVYAVLMRRDIGARVQYLEEARISIPRDQPRPASVVHVEPDAPQDPARERVIANVVATYRQVLDYALTVEVSEAMVAAMEEVGSLSLRTGVYFVPESRMSIVRALKANLERHGVHLTTWEVAATSANVAEAKHDAREAFLDQVKGVADECRAFIDSKETPNAKSVNARIKRFKDLDAKVALYSEILGDFQDEMQAAIDGARHAFMSDLGLDEAA